MLVINKRLKYYVKMFKWVDNELNNEHMIMNYECKIRSDGQKKGQSVVCTSLYNSMLIKIYVSWVHRKRLDIF